MSETQITPRLTAWVCKICGLATIYDEERGDDRESQILEHFGTEHADVLRESLR